MIIYRVRAGLLSEKARNFQPENRFYILEVNGDGSV